jgi:hypothetical protein
MASRILSSCLSLAVVFPACAAGQSGRGEQLESSSIPFVRVLWSCGWRPSRPRRRR